jgi:hypothetical protein
MQGPPSCDFFCLCNCELTLIVIFEVCGIEIASLSQYSIVLSIISMRAVKKMIAARVPTDTADIWSPHQRTCQLHVNVCGRKLAQFLGC